VKLRHFLLKALLACGASALCGPSIADTFEISGTSWFSDAAETPSTCVTFEPNGTLRFKGGYLFYNPSRWNRIAGSPELIQVRLGGKAPFPLEVAQAQVKKNPNGSLVAFNQDTRTLMYRIGFGNIPLEFNGFVFYLSEQCDA
jgi:hypothetical protein